MQDNILAVTTKGKTIHVLKVEFFAFDSAAEAAAFDEALFKAVTEMTEAKHVGWASRVEEETL